MTSKVLRSFLLLLAALAVLVSPAVAQGHGQGNAHKQKDKNRMERLEVPQRGQVLAVRLGWTRQTDRPRSMERPKRAVMPPKRRHDDLSLNRWSSRCVDFAQR